MKTINIVILTFFLLPRIVLSQATLPFGSILEQINNSNNADANFVIEKFIEQVKQVPIIEGDKVIFLAKKNSNKKPMLLSDLNGFMNPRYVKDTTLADMISILKTDWYYTEKQLHSDAIINYQFRYGDDKVNDPLNQNTRTNFGSQISFVRMPQSQPPQKEIQDFLPSKGQLIEEEFRSEILGQNRKVHIYLPENYDSQISYSVVFFHDGSFFVKEANVGDILDSLILSKRINPLIAVFDDPIIRGKEYRNDIGFRNYIKNELLSYIGKKYNVTKDSNKRAIIGFSRGGLSALYLSHSLEEFSMCGALSPAIHPKSVSTFMVELGAYTYTPIKIFITKSIYDKIWGNDASDLKTQFERQSLALQYQEINQGHNISAWKTMLDDMLISFFPLK